MKNRITKHIRKQLSKKKHLRKFWYLYLVLLIGIIVGLFFIIKELPSPTRLTGAHTPQSTQIYDRNGKLLYKIYRTKDQTFIPLSEIPNHMQQATIAIEDRNFYYHGAIDFKGIIRAFYSTVFKQNLQGGSTLTQQLVKNSLLTPERTISRKLKEIPLAYLTELLYSKNQILEMYLNQTPYGGTAWGIEAAALTYFGKQAKNLTLAESALLAGLPEAPTSFSPFGAHPERAKQRQKQVLKAMYEEKYITLEQMQKAENETLKFQKVSNIIKAPHFVLYVKDLLVKKYGERLVEEGGLKVQTSLDLTIQDYVQASVSAEIEKLKNYRVSNGAVMVTIPKTGEIIAMVGSKDYFDESIDGNVNVALALRQPGSSIKPINYAVGLIKGYTAATVFVDDKTCFPNQGGKDYCPVNYDGKFHGPVSMRYSLGNSFNIPAVKMLKLNGIDAMIATASAMGITTYSDPQRYGLSLTLGGGEVTMLNMTEAFGVFANGGYRINIHPVLKVTDKTGKVIEEYKPPKSPIFGKKVLPPGVAFIISDILADNYARVIEFGSNSELKIDDKYVSVKTGTTNDFRDNWTIGYTPSYLVAVWVGNNDNTPMSGLVSGITGAAPIWHEIMSYLLKDKPNEIPKRPSNVIQMPICNLTGGSIKAEGQPSCTTRSEYFIKTTMPKPISIKEEEVWVDKTTQDLPKLNQTDNLELKKHQILTDDTGGKYCLTCPHPTPTPSVSPTP